jgi:hypothetical protein
MGYYLALGSDWSSNNPMPQELVPPTAKLIGFILAEQGDKFLNCSMPETPGFSPSLIILQNFLPCSLSPYYSPLPLLISLHSFLFVRRNKYPTKRPYFQSAIYNQ